MEQDFRHFSLIIPACTPQDSSGTPKSASARIWWTNWWNNTFTYNGTDGWSLQADFLKKVVTTVDKHPSTLGYEILKSHKFIAEINGQR